MSRRWLPVMLVTVALPVVRATATSLPAATSGRRVYDFAGVIRPVADFCSNDLSSLFFDIRRDVLRWRHRVLKLLARHGRAYLAGKNWSQVHWRWIREQRFDLPPLQRAFEATVFALEQALVRQAELDKELEALATTAPIASLWPGSAASAGSTRCRRSSSWPRSWTSSASAGRANSWPTSGWSRASTPQAGRNTEGRSRRREMATYAVY